MAAGVRATRNLAHWRFCSGARLQSATTEGEIYPRSPICSLPAGRTGSSHGTVSGQTGDDDGLQFTSGIDAILALDQRNLATLSSEERRTLELFRARGRKHGVDVRIESDADPHELARASSKDQADELMRRANSVVHVQAHGQ